MDELEISGRRYISAVRAAKEHKYHSDYIGQLVRGGKVTGQKVGRAWYVDADSLSEYLGKEVPARGPVAKLVKSKPVEVEREVEETVKAKISKVVVEDKTEESAERSVAEPVDVRGLSADSHQSEQKDFLIPLRKLGRQHVVAALDDEPIKKIVKPVKEIYQEPAQVEANTDEEEETFIPLKITKEKPRDIYQEPEDSFYKVSRKGLRIVQMQTPVQEYEEERVVIAPHTVPVQKIKNNSRVASAISLVLVAGILSLGAGALMSYYLHSITTVEDAGQTSSVILSN